MIEGAGAEERFRQRVLEALYRKDPTHNTNLKIRALGESGESPVRYFVYADVLQELVKAARFRQESAMALLLGQFSIDEQGPFVEVSAFQDLSYLYGEDDLVGMARPWVREFYRDDRDGQAQEGVHIVGVFASRPGSEGFLDEEIARLHLSVFNLPFQAALIMDALSERLGLYARGIGQPFFNAPFFVAEPAPGVVDEGDEGREADELLGEGPFIFDDERR